MKRMIDLRPLTLADRSLIGEYLHSYPPVVSEHTFTNLFVWQPSRPILFAEIGDAVVFLVKAAGETGKYLLLGPPVGDRTLSDVFTLLQEVIIGAVRIPEAAALQLPAGEYEISPDRDNADYVYRVDDLAGLAGRHYTKKRNHINQCLGSHSCEYLPMTAEIIGECEAMQDKWCHTRDCGRSPGLCNEANAIAETFAHFDELGLLGGAIRVDGLVQAYAIAEQLHPGTAVWHFEKAMVEVPGLGQLITHWFSRYGLSGFEFVNREQDLGIPGMRQAKESYYPDHMVSKNSISRSTDQPMTATSIKAEGCAAHEH